MKALGLVVSDKKIFKSFILKPYLLTLWPTYATNWNGLNNFDRGPPRDHSCKVWSKSNEWFQRRCCFYEMLTHARTHACTHDGRRTLKDHKSSPLSTSCSGELKKNWHLTPCASHTFWGIIVACDTVLSGLSKPWFGKLTDELTNKLMHAQTPVKDLSCQADPAKSKNLKNSVIFVQFLILSIFNFRI